MLEEYKNIFAKHVEHLQDEITSKLRELDPSINLVEDIWKREDAAGNDGGGGRTRAFTGDVIENAGVNISLVHGKSNPDFIKKIGGDGDEFWATGISLIIHPRNPRVPTVHANFRMIQAGSKFWFGGGADLTPFYPHTEDFKYFHNVWKKAVAPYGYYEEWKEKCDQYFVNKHRNNEMRGVGGIFFDQFNTGDVKNDVEMIKDISNYFIESYFPIAQKRKDEEFTAEDEDFQLHRRGRYVEFNLLHDRGTHFGLQTNGRTDSILISLPARCKYTYKYAPAENGPHFEMLKYYYPQKWA